MSSTNLRMEPTKSERRFTLNLGEFLSIKKDKNCVTH